MKRVFFVFFILTASNAPRRGQAVAQPRITQPTKPGVLSPQDLARISAKKEWVLAAGNIYDRTRDREAKAVLDFVAADLVTVSPVAEGWRFLEPAQANRPWTLFLPLMPQDRANPRLRSLVNDLHAFARFNPDDNIIVVRNLEPWSKFWKGIAILHEGHHAGDMHFASYNWRDPQVFSEKETAVHNFQNRLTSLVGGEAYAGLLQKELATIRLRLLGQGVKSFKRQPGGSTNIKFPNRSDYNPELDKIFGLALSQIEKDARQTSFWIQAVFLGYETDRGPGPEAEAGKAAFMRAGYTQDGILAK